MAHVKDLNTLEYEVVGLKVTLWDSLQRTMHVVFGVYYRVMEQAKRLCPTAEILVEKLNPFHPSSKWAQDGGHGTSTPDASA